MTKTKSQLNSRLSEILEVIRTTDDEHEYRMNIVKYLVICRKKLIKDYDTNEEQLEWIHKLQKAVKQEPE